MKDLHLTPLPYPLPSGDGAALLVTCYAGEPDFLYHYHPEYELTVTLGSAGRRLVGSSVADYASRDFVLLGPNLPHTWAAERLQGRGKTAQNCVVHFTCESLGLDFLARRELRDIASLLNRAASGLVFDGAGAEAAAKLMRELGRLKGGQRMITFLTLMQKLATEVRARPILQKERSPVNLERDYVVLAGVVDFIHRRSEATICLAEVAARVGMSVPTFCRFFRRATGMSFINYLNDWRISRACALLAGSACSVLEISERAGFSNLSHFNRQFLRRRGITPSQFRKNIAIN
jgi:AraC-like DNA-binding protein